MAHLEKKLAEDLQKTNKPALSLAQKQRSLDTANKPEKFNWHLLALSSLCLVLVLTTAVALYALNRVGELSQQLGETMDRMERKTQQLDSSISFDSKRRYLALGIRDEILDVNANVSLTEAYQYAMLILEASERYPTVDPLLFLAIGVVESNYDKAATSRADARGLYQIWPATGHLLARVLGWEYADEMLYDPQRNTEMAALYLDILFSAYHDERLVLAEYNGGPLNAGYLRAGSSKTAIETQQYVPQVLGIYEKLKAKFERGVGLRAEAKHRDQARDGKLLPKRESLGDSATVADDSNR